MIDFIFKAITFEKITGHTKNKYPIVPSHLETF